MLTALKRTQLLLLLIRCWGPPAHGAKCAAGIINTMSRYHKATLNIMIELAALLHSAITVCKKITMVQTQPGRLLPTLRRKLLPLGSVNTDTEAASLPLTSSFAPFSSLCPHLPLIRPPQCHITSFFCFSCTVSASHCITHLSIPFSVQNISGGTSFLEQAWKEKPCTHNKPGGTAVPVEAESSDSLMTTQWPMTQFLRCFRRVVASLCVQKTSVLHTKYSLHCSPSSYRFSQDPGPNHSLPCICTTFLLA
jgi:hypothetical protein